MIPGAGSYVEDCLESHGSEVSAACRKNLGDVTASADAIRAACDSASRATATTTGRARRRAGDDLPARTPRQAPGALPDAHRQSLRCLLRSDRGRRRDAMAARRRRRQSCSPAARGRRSRHSRRSHVSTSEPAQGVFVDAADGTVLASEAADRPVHPASVTKVATSLALLDRLGPEHRFETRFVTTGQLTNGRPRRGSRRRRGRRSLLRLRERVPRAVASADDGRGADRRPGRVPHGAFLFNWQPDPTGARLREDAAGPRRAPRRGPKPATARRSRARRSRS